MKHGLKRIYPRLKQLEKRDSVTETAEIDRQVVEILLQGRLRAAQGLVPQRSEEEAASEGRRLWALLAAEERY
jgi:hypothetical protein